MSDRVWPVDLEAALPGGGRVALRAMRGRDRAEYLAVKARNRDWLRPWDPTNPDGIATTVTYRRMLRDQRAAARAGTAYSFAITLDGSFAGQLQLANVARGAFRSCTMGYWVGREFAGRGVAPVAVALAADHALGPIRLHRVQIDVRPENAASLAVVRKLGMRDEGLRLNYLHIDGAWRDHRTFAVTREDLGSGGLLDRVLANLGRHIGDTPAQVPGEAGGRQ